MFQRRSWWRSTVPGRTLPGLLRLQALRQRRLPRSVVMGLGFASLLTLCGCGTAPSDSASLTPTVPGELMERCRPPAPLASQEIDEALANVAENAARANECRSRVLGWQQWARERGFAP